MTAQNNLVPPSERNYGNEHIAIGSDVRVTLTTLVGDQNVPWHLHTNISDMFFCLEGTVVVQTRGQDEGVTLNVGDRYEVKPGTEHCVRSADGERCRFLLVQGVGKADFVRSRVLEDANTS